MFPSILTILNRYGTRVQQFATRIRLEVIWDRTHDLKIGPTTSRHSIPGSFTLLAAFDDRVSCWRDDISALVAKKVAPPFLNSGFLIYAQLFCDGEVTSFWRLLSNSKKTRLVTIFFYFSRKNLKFKTFFISSKRGIKKFRPHFFGLFIFAFLPPLMIYFGPIVDDFFGPNELNLNLRRVFLLARLTCGKKSLAIDELMTRKQLFCPGVNIVDYFRNIRS